MYVCILKHEGTIGMTFVVHGIYIWVRHLLSTTLTSHMHIHGDALYSITLRIILYIPRLLSAKHACIGVNTHKHSICMQCKSTKYRNVDVMICYPQTTKYTHCILQNYRIIKEMLYDKKFTGCPQGWMYINKRPGILHR